MPADIDKMFSVREVPWHKPRTGDLTTVTGDYPQTFAEARKLAGLDWDPIALPAIECLAPEAVMRDQFRKVVIESAGQSVTTSVTDLMTVFSQTNKIDPEFRRIARSDNLRTLSYQRDSYNIIPNSVFGEIIDSIVGAEPGMVRLETGGSLLDGRKVWMLARLDEPMQVTAPLGGVADLSLSYPFLAITSDHTGHASCAARLTMVRIVCGNTFSAAEAEGERSGLVYSFSHRGDWRARVGEAREALQFARNEAREYAEVMSNLLAVKITPKQEMMWLREFIPEPPDGLMSDRVAKNIGEARKAVLGFLASETVEGAGVRGTAYGLVQAAGEYLDHARKSRTWESKMNRSLLKIEPLKAKAATLARDASLM